MSMQPGWYPDPFSSGGYVRWWDGQRWGASTTAPSTDPEAVPALPGSPVAMPAMPPAPGVGPVGHGAEAAAGVPLASWGSRAGARLLDLLIETVLAVPFVYVLLGPAIRDFEAAVPVDATDEQIRSATTTLVNSFIAASLALTLVVLVISFVYEVPQNLVWGRTLGKRVTGIRIRPLVADGPLRFGQVVIRWATYSVVAAVVGTLWALVDYLWPLWDKPWRQALHDKTARTIVVRRTP